MNKLTNDWGEVVIAEGAPGSVARAKCLYPKLLNKVLALIAENIDYKIEGITIAEAILDEAKNRMFIERRKPQ
jgi:hypothetical protein